MNDKVQKISSYKTASGLTIYEAKQYNANSRDWYVVGDCSSSKNLITGRIEHHNLSI